MLHFYFCAFEPFSTYWQGCLQLGKNIKLWVKRREFHGCEEEYNMEKGKGEQYNIPYSIKLRLLGKISSGKKRKWTEMSGKKIKISKMEAGKKIR